MVFTGLINLVFAAATHIVNLLPSYTSSLNDASGALGFFVGIFRAFQGWINIAAILGVLALAVTIELGVQVTRAVVFVWKVWQ